MTISCLDQPSKQFYPLIDKSNAYAGFEEEHNIKGCNNRTTGNRESGFQPF